MFRRAESGLESLDECVGLFCGCCDGFEPIAGKGGVRGFIGFEESCRTEPDDKESVVQFVDEFSGDRNARCLALVGCGCHG